MAKMVNNDVIDVSAFLRFFLRRTKPVENGFNARFFGVLTALGLVQHAKPFGI